MKNKKNNNTTNQCCAKTAAGTHYKNSSVEDAKLCALHVDMGSKVEYVVKSSKPAQQRPRPPTMS